MSSDPEIQTALKRETYFKFLSDVIVEWQSDPRGYDLKLLAHELQVAGAPRMEGVAPGDFLAMLGRCQRRGAKPPQPMAPLGAQFLRAQQVRQRQLLEEERCLLEGRPLHYLPARFRGPWPRRWEPVEGSESGAVMSRLVEFDWPDAPVGAVLYIGADMGLVPGVQERRIWYRAYCKINRYPQADVQIIAEGTSPSVVGARTVVSRKLNLFVHEQCDAEPLPEEPPSPNEHEVYRVDVMVKLSRRDVAALSEWSHQTELAAVVTKAVKKYAADRGRLREEQQRARAARRAGKVQESAG